MANENEIAALIKLLDDDDSEVFKHVYAKLKSYGTDVIPTLEEVWSSGLDPVTHERLEEIIHEIQYDSLVADWELWLKDETPDLLTGAFLLAKYHYPDIKIDDIRKSLMKLRQSIWLELNYNQTPLEQVQIFNQVFYSYHEFKGMQNSNNFNDFCLNCSLDSKKGNSIIIGIIYQVIANELNLPVYGVNLSRHFILAFCKKTILDFSLEQNNGKDVMFYVNPANKGSIFSRNEIKDYLDKLKSEHEQNYFTPSDNVGIIKELMSYLLEIYTRQNEHDRLRELNYLLQLM
jgi:regulator of sirC expression with transglutaminase-like and TPR domain